jgi:hypothetical protein
LAGQTALVPTGPGLSIEMDEDKLAKFALDLLPQAALVKRLRATFACD